MYDLGSEIPCADRLWRRRRIIDDDIPRPCSSGIEDGEAGEIWMMMMMMMLLFVRCVCKGM